MNDIIFDGENYYLFRALSNADIKDEYEGKKEIRTNSTRIYEEYGIWGKYTGKSSISLEELYDHIKIKHRYDTNCISLTRNSNAVLTYGKNNDRYALVKVNPEEMSEYFETGEYFRSEINKRVKNAIDNLDKEDLMSEILRKIDSASSKQELSAILSDNNLSIQKNIVNNKQYLSKNQQLDMDKMLTKLMLLEDKGAIGEIIKGVPNRKLIATMNVAYSSSEYTHYGSIAKDLIIRCPKLFIDIFSILQQKQQENTEDISNIIKEILALVKSGYDLGIRNGKPVLGNEENYLELELNKNDIAFLLRDYSERQKIKKGISLDNAYALSNGKISYKDTCTQIIAIRALAEMKLKKQIITDILKETVTQDVEKLLKNTYCINPELVVRQNNRGHKISETVNILIADKGYKLDKETTKQILKSIDCLSTKDLLDIYFHGINAKQINKMLVKQSNSKGQLKLNYQRARKVRYTVEGIVEGFNWRGIGRPLTKIEKDKLARRIIVYSTNKNEILELYLELQKLKIRKRELTQEEIFASIINIAIDGKLGDVSYKELLESTEKNKILLQNVPKLQTTVDTIQLDLLMNRGKNIEALKQELIDLGIDEEFIEQKDIKNVYIAKKIVDGYQFNKELKPEEKKAILQSILSNKQLNKENSRYLSNIVANFKKIGLTNQEIYGAIINSAIESSAINESSYNYSNLIHSPSRILELSTRTSELNIIVKQEIIQKAIVDTMDNQEMGGIIKELANLGIEEEFLNQKNEKNLYMAKKIVEDYRFNRELASKEKGALIKSILDSYSLDKKSSCYLTTVVKNLKKMGLKEQDIYSLIMDLSVNRSKRGYDYDTLLTSSSTQARDLIKNKEDVGKPVSPILIQIALVNQMSDLQVEKTKQELIDLGIEEDFTNQKDIRNLCMAKLIVDSYNFNRELKKEEKAAVIKQILNCVTLNAGYGNYLTTLAYDLEKIGFSEQEVHGAIINLAINGSIMTDEKSYFYTELLGSSIKARELSNHKDKIDTEIIEVDIQKAISSNMKKEQEDELIKELISLGLDKEFIEEKDIKNMYIAKKIVDGYKFNGELKLQEKRAILQEILKSSLLNKDGTIYLAAITTNLRRIGLKDQQVYGAVINLAINGSIIDKDGYSYYKLLPSAKRIMEMRDYKGDIDCKVNSGTIGKIAGRNLNTEEENQLKGDLIDLGLDKEFLEQKDIRNIYMANKILEDYKFQQDLTKEDKKAIIQTLLGSKGSNKGELAYIDQLANSLYKLGLTKQEVYGTIINLAINGRVIEETGYNYDKLMRKPSKVAELANYKITTEVSSSTIENAKKKAEQIMRRAIKRLKKEGKLCEIVAINRELEELVEKSISDIKDCPK